jgi:hypothetical protein
MGDVGSELSAESSQKTAIADASAAFLRAGLEVDADLAKVVEAWPRLSADQKQRILNCLGE